MAVLALLKLVREPNFSDFGDAPVCRFSGMVWFREGAFHSRPWRGDYEQFTAFHTRVQNAETGGTGHEMRPKDRGCHGQTACVWPVPWRILRLDDRPVQWGAISARPYVVPCAGLCNRRASIGVGLGLF